MGEEATSKAHEPPEGIISHVLIFQAGQGREFGGLCHSNQTSSVLVMRTVFWMMCIIGTQLWMQENLTLVIFDD